MLAQATTTTTRSRFSRRPWAMRTNCPSPPSTIFRTEITTCFAHRVGTGPCFVLGLQHVDLRHGGAAEVVLGGRDAEGAVHEAGEEDVELRARRVGLAVLAPYLHLFIDTLGSGPSSAYP